MPIENEFKYLLHNYKQFKSLLNGAFPVEEIDQLYTAGGGRFRKVERNHGSPHHYFTYKEMIGDSLLEVETAIPASDFDLAATAAVSRLRKTRFKFEGKVASNLQYGPYVAKWDIDFLYNAKGEIYIGLIEVEVPPEVKEPPPLVNWMEDYVVRPIRKYDSVMFTNRLLANEEYARNLVARGYI